MDWSFSMFVKIALSLVHPRCKNVSGKSKRIIFIFCCTIISKRFYLIFNNNRVSIFMLWIYFIKKQIAF